MRVKLDNLEFFLKDETVLSEHVSVHFEYRELENKALKIYLNCLVGSDVSEKVYRYQLKLIYIIDLTGIEYNTDEEMLEQALTFLTEPLGDLVATLDSMIMDKQIH